MKPLAELYTLADPVFFEDPVYWQEGHAEFAPDVPAGWTRSGADGWVMLTPPGAELPAQGWKIHVSATPESAESTVDIVARYCFTQ
ncbi:MAG TPA: hypothetical protein VJX66_15245, partial [Amycolatopsis sp.]|nr:hypothetical protein [Amycolatopsis sp.]